MSWTDKLCACKQTKQSRTDTEKKVTIRRDTMIYKVLYQQSFESPSRESTKTIYVEADSERDVRKKLAEKNLNIEFIQLLSESHLAYEKKSEDFELESV